MNSKKIDPLLLALAHVLRQHRRAQRLSQEELAFRAGRSMRYVSLLEGGKHQPTLETLNQISRVLDIPLSRLISEAENIVAASKTADG